MAVGWANENAVQEQMDATIIAAVELAKSRLPDGESLTYCEKCDVEIPEARRKAVPGVRLCVHCQAEQEKRENSVELYNRRGSKDSQLR